MTQQRIEQARTAVRNLYLASRRAPSTADAHDVYAQCADNLNALLDELAEPKPATTPPPTNPPAP